MSCFCDPSSLLSRHWPAPQFGLRDTMERGPHATEWAQGQRQRSRAFVTDRVPHRQQLRSRT